MSTMQSVTTAYVTLPSNLRMAYRILQPSAPNPNVLPLLMHIHYRANMDFWDPDLVNPIALKRPVILFDQPGVGKSDGEVAATIQGWANNVIALCDALGLSKIDLFGFSMGGYTVQMVALTRPTLIRKLVIAGSGPSAPGEYVDTRGIVWPRDFAPKEVFAVLSKSDPESEAQIENAIAVSFFPPTAEGRANCESYFQRIRASKSVDTEKTSLSLLDVNGTKLQNAAAIEWHQVNSRNSFDRLGEMKMPVLVLNGDDDLLIPTSRSWELVKKIENCHLIVYPKAGHGFLWQYAGRVARDVNTFLEHDLARSHL